MGMGGGDFSTTLEMTNRFLRCARNDRKAALEMTGGDGVREVCDYWDRLLQKGLFLGEACVFLDRLPRAGG